MVTINMDYWDSLSGEQKAAISKGAEEIEASQWSKAEKKTLEAIAIIKENGVTITAPSEALSAAMNQAAILIVDEFAEQADEETQALLAQYTR